MAAKATNNSQKPLSLVDQLAHLTTRATRLLEVDVAQLRQQYEAQFIRHNLRLRPSVAGFSLVSCSENTPQLGFSGLTTLGSLKKKLIALEENSFVLKSPKRETPEKKLQSWLLKSAMSARGELNVLPKNDGYKYWVVSDEVALTTPSKNNEKKRIVADLLLVKESSDGNAQLVSVELKSGRTMDTFSQVGNFRSLLDRQDLKTQWQAFAEAMLTRKFRWQEPWASKGVVVWPALRPGGVAPQSTRNRITAYKGLDIVGYETGSPYTFQMEQST